MPPDRRRGRPPLPAARAAAAALLCALCGGLPAGCARQISPVRTSPGTTESPGVAWTPPPGAAPAPSATPAPPAIPPDLLAAAQSWGLPELVDLALRNSPVTRAAWASARSAAAALGGEKGAYYPTLVGQVNATRTKGSAVGGQFTFLTSNYSPSLQLNYLLLDFGGRRATVEEARQALIAANFDNNATLQNVMLQVEAAYYQYQYARTLLQAQEASVKEAQASLDAAEHRHDAGVGTIADVLQAKTALSQAELALQTTEGQVQTIRGVLATAVGLPANTPYDVAPLPAELPVAPLQQEVDRLIEDAQARRPDLAAARARVDKAQAHVDKMRAADRPFVSTNLNSSRIFYEPEGNHQDTYGASLLLTIPVFNGLRYQYDLLRAEADAEAARAERDTLGQEVVSQVWTSYYNLKTASRRVDTSADLLESAAKSYEVASARYKAGVGSILDLLTAESALLSARAQQAQARTDWLISVAQLAHDTGALGRPAGDVPKGAP
jgi:outer membrane protein